MKQTQKTDHEPVLMAEVLQYLHPHRGDIYLDVTAGYGGHAREILARTKAPAVLVDRDHYAIDYLAGQFNQQSVELVQRDFLTASQQLLKSGRRFDLILADLGVSSPHLNMASRGFSIQREGPLDMRMDNNQALNAATIINTYSEAALIELIRRYGEEPSAHKIAKAIVQSRPFETTIELANLISRVVPRGRSKVHPATRTFQALRIAVNDELGQLEQALPIWNELLRPGGRLAVISFHSLEDRLVKQYFQAASGGRYDSSLHLLTKRPATASHHELAFNPRARSAKLRAAVKIKT
ncbi:MAG: 16S rRNA (cytosine(1402)-N(4))-methyltransferase RsmH [Candidatus Saccharimonadales bacterium]